MRPVRLQTFVKTSFRALFSHTAQVHGPCVISEIHGIIHAFGIKLGARWMSLITPVFSSFGQAPEQTAVHLLLNSLS